MIKTIRIGALLIALASTAAWAQTEDATTDSSTWRDSVIARCLQQYSAEQCQDENFLEENFHIHSLEVAHHTATRRNQQAAKALHELTLQRVCNDSLSNSCAKEVDAEQCVVQISQACAILLAEAKNCVASAQQTCVDNADPNCYKNHLALCPSLKKQPIAQLLAKYPKLTAAQKARLTAAAAELDAKTSGWWSNLVSWLKTPFF